MSLDITSESTFALMRKYGCEGPTSRSSKLIPLIIGTPFFDVFVKTIQPGYLDAHFRSQCQHRQYFIDAHPQAYTCFITRNMYAKQWSEPHTRSIRITLIFALIVYVTDGYLKVCRPRWNQAAYFEGRQRRFFAIATQLPMDLQLSLPNIMHGLPSDSRADIDASIFPAAIEIMLQN